MSTDESLSDKIYTHTLAVLHEHGFDPPRAHQAATAILQRLQAELGGARHYLHALGADHRFGEIARRCAAGESPAAIAQAIGISVRTVYRARRRLAVGGG